MMPRSPDMRDGPGIGKEQSGARVIEDYKLEELLRCPFRLEPKNERDESRPTDVSWRQVVQYSVSHIVNDYFGRLPEYRSEQAIRRFADRRWSNKAYKFESAEHYWHIRDQAVGHLIRFLEEGRDIRPLVLFESFRCPIPAVESDISFIVQMLHRRGDAASGPYEIQKYVVDDDPGVIAGFRHLAVLFCREAFGALPDRMDVFGVLSGKRYVMRPKEDDVARAADYVRLLRDYAPAAAEPGASREAICGKCALRAECDRPDRHAGRAVQRFLLH